MLQSTKQPTPLSEALLYPNASTVIERMKIDKIKAINYCYNYIYISKDIRNQYETETKNYSKNKQHQLK